MYWQHRIIKNIIKTYEGKHWFTAYVTGDIYGSLPGELNNKKKKKLFFFSYALEKKIFLKVKIKFIQKLTYIHITI